MNIVKNRAIRQKMSELHGEEWGWYLTIQKTSSFFKLGKPSKVQIKSWLNVLCVALKLKVA